MPRRRDFNVRTDAPIEGSIPFGSGRLAVTPGLVLVYGPGGERLFCWSGGEAEDAARLLEGGDCRSMAAALRAARAEASRAYGGHRR